MKIANLGLKNSENPKLDLDEKKTAKITPSKEQKISKKSINLAKIKEKSFKNILKILANDKNLTSKEDISKAIVELKNIILAQGFDDMNLKLKNLLDLLAGQKNLNKEYNFLKNLLQNPKIDIKQGLLSSGIFLESKLLKALKNKDTNNLEKLSKDLKFILLNIKTKTSDDGIKILNTNILNQIDAFGLLSLLSSSSWTFLNFFYKDFKNISIKINKEDEDKIFCKLELDVEKYSKLNFELFLHTKNKVLDILIDTKSKEFKEIFLKNKKILEKSLSHINIHAHIIFKKPYEKKENLYLKTYYDGFGLDIKV